MYGLPLKAAFLSAGAHLVQFDFLMVSVVKLS